MKKLKIPDNLAEPSTTSYEYKFETRRGWHYIMVRELPDGKWEHYQTSLGRKFRYQEQHYAEEFVQELTRLYGKKQAPRAISA